MVEGNGGEITVGERLRRIESRFEKVEDRLEKIDEHLENRISRHRAANEQAVKELASGIVSDFGSRVSKLETEQISAEKVRSALEKYQAKQATNFRWAVGLLASLAAGNLIINFQQGV